MTLVFMFPGQSSRYPEMLEKLAARCARVIEEASDVLGRDLAKHYRASNPNIFATNRDVQVGVFVANHAYLRLLDGLRARRSLGLSLGEYNHLVHIGAISFADALRLVDARGAAYDAGPEGAMVSVFPLALEDLEPIVARARAHGALEIANLNSSKQNVIAGSRAALDAAIAELEDLGCACVEIESRIPMHTSLFRAVADALLPHLERASWLEPWLPYLPNVTARFERDPVRIPERLAQHVYSPVLWRASIDLVTETLRDPVFVEVGPRAVLCNLLPRTQKKYRTDIDTLDAALEEIARAA